MQTETDDELLSLYQEIILDHGRHPRNSGVVEEHTCESHGKNPLCGDRIQMTARVDESGVIEDLKFDAKGCAISVASASLMSAAVKGRTVDEVRRLFEGVQSLCTGEGDVDLANMATTEEQRDQVEKLSALSGVRRFPVRVKCATLPWHTMLSCFDGTGKATTE